MHTCVHTWNNFKLVTYYGNLDKLFVSGDLLIFAYDPGALNPVLDIGNPIATEFLPFLTRILEQLKTFDGLKRGKLEFRFVLNSDALLGDIFKSLVDISMIIS